MNLESNVHNVLQAVVDRSLRSRRIANMVFRSAAFSGSRVFRDFGDHRLVFDPTETVGRRLLSKGNFNRDATLQAIEMALGTKSGGVMIEIGANIGTQTVYAALAHDFDRIIAIEPDSQNMQLLRSNIDLNGLADRVELVHGALSSSSGILELKRTVHNSGASTVEKDTGWIDSAGVTTEQVTAHRGDDLFEALGVSPDEILLIWVDVEGHEASVFEGMPNTLRSKPAIYFEYSAQRLTAERREVIFRLVFEAYDNVYLHRDGVFRPLSRKEFEELPNRRAHVDLLAM